MMDPAKRIITRIPLTELWNSDGTLEARRIGHIGREEIIRLLQNGSSFVVADIGQPLLWIHEEDRWQFWKTEVSCRLVAPGATGFSPSNYPGAYCFVTTMWQLASATQIVAVEKHH